MRTPRPTALTTALAPRPALDTRLAATTLARCTVGHAEVADGSILSWSLIGLETFSLTPTILQAINRVRVLSGLEPLRQREDGTLDFSNDPLWGRYGGDLRSFLR